MLSTIGTKISSARVGKGLSQAQLATSTGIALVKIQRAEAGTRGLALSERIQVARKLAVNISAVS